MVDGDRRDVWWATPESMKRKRPGLVRVTQVKKATTETRFAFNGKGLCVHRKNKNKIS